MSQLNPEERDLVLAMLGHDLKQPLAIIKMVTSHALRGDDPEVARRALMRVEMTAARMTEMIDQLVDFSRIRHRLGIALDRQPTDMRDLIRGIIDDFLVLKAGQKFEVEYHDSPIGIWDRQRLIQVFTNLVGNAIYHGIPDEPIRIRIQPDDGCVEVRVCNFGEVTSELLPDKIWDPFKRGFRSSKGGLGLGLYIAKYFVEAHGGTVRVDVGKGLSCFIVRLPEK